MTGLLGELGFLGREAGPSTAASPSLRMTKFYGAQGEGVGCSG